MKIAVITGASSGMGREFAIQLSHEANFDDMWVIARRKEALESLKDQVCCPIRPIAMDLLNPDSFQRYADLLDMVQPEIKVLVNCAGFGKFGRYDQIPLQDCMNMIDLNCKALVAMTQLSLLICTGTAKSSNWTPCPRSSLCHTSMYTAPPRLSSSATAAP